MKLREKITALLLLSLLLAACTPKVRLNVLSFLFDGVPDPTLVSEITPGDSLLFDNSDSLSVEFTVIPSMYYHYPYQEKECMSCHDQNIVGNLIDSEPGLCYACHEDYNYVFESLHGPVDAGYCTACHEPHMSKNKKLLILKGNELCLQCHISYEENPSIYHAEIGDENCITCHNPHGEIELTSLNLVY